MADLPIACNLTESEFQIRRGSTLERVRNLAKEVKSLKAGYSFRFTPEDGLLLDLAAMIEQERKCCPFLDFELIVESATGPLWLKITGPEGTKSFLRDLFQLT